MRLSIIQPYFYPYKNYFNLISSSDLTVILDDVQFIRRGYIHRCILNNEKKQWLTLPIEKKNIDTKINEMEFKKIAQLIFNQRLQKNDLIFKHLKNDKNFSQALKINDQNLLKYLIKNIKYCCSILDIKFNYIYSSEIRNKYGKKESIIIDICKKLGASQYLNLPGGKSIYKKQNFEKNNIKLKFLNNYTGSYDSIFNELFITIKKKSK